MPSSRRTARTPPATPKDDVMPAHLAAGPCLEDWWDNPTRPYWARDEGFWPPLYVRRRWATALKEWAVAHGYGTPEKPVAEAMRLARIRTPWSRQFLLERGETDYVDWLDGRRATFPGRAGSGFQPHH